MAEARLRQVWAGLMPPFPEPEALLSISDPDHRAVTMLLKTLYTVCKGVLEDRHRLRCCEPGSSAAAEPQPCAAADPQLCTVSGAAGQQSSLSSPGDLVPPSPGSDAHSRRHKRSTVPVPAPAAQQAVLVPAPAAQQAVLVPAPATQPAVPVPAPAAQQAVLVPETAEVGSPRRRGRPPLPVAETAPPPAVWVPETLEPVRRPGGRPCPVPETLEPVRRPGGRPCPVPETLEPGPRPVRETRESGPRPGPVPPVTPPRPVRQPEAASPLLSGAARRSRRAAGRPTTPPAAPGLGSPLLLPQRPPERPRRPAPATADRPPAEAAQESDRPPAGPARRQSKLSRSAPRQPETTAETQSGPSAGGLQQSPPAKRKKYRFIGPHDPVTPRKRRRDAPTQGDQEQPMPSEFRSTQSPQRTPSATASQSGGSTPTRSAWGAAAAVSPVKAAAQSIFELPAAASTPRRCTNSGRSANTEPAAGDLRSDPPELTAGQPDLTGVGSAPAAAAGMGSARTGVGSARAGTGRPSQSAESVVGLDVLLDELNHGGSQSQARSQGVCHSACQPGDGCQDPGRDRAEAQTAAPAGEDPGAAGTGAGEATTTPPHGHPPDHESQETQMDSPLFGEKPAAGPGRRYDAGPVRRRADRQKLPGWACAVCKQWYADREMTEEELRKHMNRCSRHRQQEPPPPDTPPGFWDPVGFPTLNVTQHRGPDTRGTRARRRL